MIDGVQIYTEARRIYIQRQYPLAPVIGLWKQKAKCRMKNVCLVFACLLFGSQLLPAQIFVEKGNMKVRIEVFKDEVSIPIDSLCSGFDPLTNVPIDFVVPEGSSVALNTDSITTNNLKLMLNNREPNYINQPGQRNSGFSMSASSGSTNSYSFIDEATGDTLKIAWMVGYDKIKLLDLYPANYFTDYLAYAFQNIFEKYPDSVLYDWSTVDFVQERDERGLPVSPNLPYDYPGLFFVVYSTEDAMVKMEGLHDEFHRVDTDDPFKLFLYEDIDPGTYTFTVQPYDGAPEELWLHYPFTVQEPWWNTGRAQFLIGIIATLLLGGIVLLLIVNAQKRKQQELRWKQQLTDAELKAIRAQLNPHFLFNALNSIQNLVTQQKNESANLYINKLSRLLRQVLSSSEKQFQELSDELALTQLYLELEQLRYPFSFQIEVGDSVDKHTLVPVMLLQPYVENAVKHGVAGHNAGVITLKVSSGEERLHFTISDNGPGLSAAGDRSKGLELGQNRIHHLNNLYLEQASVSIKNRTDESGVVVNISLPLE